MKTLYKHKRGGDILDNFEGEVIDTWPERGKTRQGQL
jgi:hypothetical protein